MGRVHFLAFLTVAILVDADRPDVLLRGTHRHAQESVGTVTSLRLINAETDEPVAGYDPLFSTALIDLSKFTVVPNFNIEASVAGSVGSLQWDFNGDIRNEEFAPWALCGNAGPDFKSCDRLKAGTNATIKVTPYSGKSGTGTTGRSFTILVAIINTGGQPAKIPTLTLVNAITDQDIGPLLPGTIVNSAYTPYINIRCDPDPLVEVQSVVFKENGLVYRIENGAPYAFNGNLGNDYFSLFPSFGDRTIVATPYSKKDGLGIEWPSVTVTFTFTYIQPPTPAPTTQSPTSSPRPTMAYVWPTTPPPVPRDETLPELLNFTLLSSATVDLLNGPVMVNFETVAKDNRDNWYNEPTLVAVRKGPPGEGTTKIRGVNFVPPVSVGGVPTVFTNGIDFPEKYMPNGTYLLEVSLADNSVNIAQFSTQDLIDRNFPSQLTVVNVKNPLLKNFTAKSSTSVWEGSSVTFLVETDSNQFRFNMFHKVNNEYKFFSRGVDDTSSFSYTISNLQVGEYNIGIFFESRPGNQPDYRHTIMYESEDLIARGFPGFLNVTNSQS